jgi:hypothetical protein
MFPMTKDDWYARVAALLGRRVTEYEFSGFFEDLLNLATPPAQAAEAYVKMRDES